MDKGTWRAMVHGVAQSQTWLRNWTTTRSSLYKIQNQGHGWRRGQREADPAFPWLGQHFTLLRWKLTFPNFNYLRLYLLLFFFKSGFISMKINPGKWAHTVYISLETISESTNWRQFVDNPLNQRKYSQEIFQVWLLLFITFQFS